MAFVSSIPVSIPSLACILWQSNVAVERLQAVVEGRLVLVPSPLDRIGTLKHGVGRLKRKCHHEAHAFLSQRLDIGEPARNVALASLITLCDQRRRIRGIFE